MKVTSVIISLAVAIIPVFAAPLVSVIPTIDLKSAKTFALTAVGGITNTGADAVSINGDVGTTGHDVTGFAAGAITGSIEVRTPAAVQASADALAVFKTLHALTGTVVSPTLLGGAVFTPGVYTASGELSITGNITFSGNGTFVFVTGGELVASTGVSIILEDGATADDIWYAAGSSSTLGAGATFEGTILSGSSISLGEGATVNGGVYSSSVITTDGNTITLPF